MLSYFLIGCLILAQLTKGSTESEGSDIINEINVIKEGKKYPVVLINGWGGSSLDGTTTNDTENYVSYKCNTKFADKRIWISLGSILNFVITKKQYSHYIHTLISFIHNYIHIHTLNSFLHNHNHICIHYYF